MEILDKTKLIKAQTETKADIYPRSVDVTIKDAEKVYGDEDPDFEVEYEARNGDRGHISNDEIRFNLSRTPGEDVGTYTIKNTMQEVQGNYNVTFIKDKLTITQKRRGRLCHPRCGQGVSG
ncbi:MAG: MBG domain-containing protein [Coriobacteriales bacterium]|nr:MBG domain-containing protein [Coriobacteriales bacterium]